MEHEIIELNQEIERLLQSEDVDCGDTGKEYLLNLLILIKDSIRWNKIFDYIMDLGPRLPFDVTLQLNEISGWCRVGKIEEEWVVSGFNDWYKETYGITVEEASEGDEVVKNS